MTMEIVDLPINSMVIFHSYVSLPEGNNGQSAKLEDIYDIGPENLSPQYSTWGVWHPKLPQDSDQTMGNHPTMRLNHGLSQ